MEAMIKNDDEKMWMTPLLEFRNELGDFKAEASRRDYRRMNGSVFLGTRKSDGGRYLVRGPYRPKWRQHWLRRLLEVQEEIRKTGPPDVAQIELISIPELHEIRRIWLHEKHEFDDALPAIYQDVTSKKLECLEADDNLLGREEWEILREVCGEDEGFLQLQMQLLDIERNYRSMSRRSGIFDDLESCLKTGQFESEEEAVAARQDQEERRRRIDKEADNPMPQPGLLISMPDESDEPDVFQIGKRDGI